MEVARHFVETWIASFGVPLVSLIDIDSQVISKLFQRIYLQDPGHQTDVQSTLSPCNEMEKLKGLTQQYWRSFEGM